MKVLQNNRHVNPDASHSLHNTLSLLFGTQPQENTAGTQAGPCSQATERGRGRLPALEPRQLSRGLCMTSFRQQGTIKGLGESHMIR